MRTSCSHLNRRASVTHIEMILQCAGYRRKCVLQDTCSNVQRWFSHPTKLRARHSAYRRMGSKLGTSISYTDSGEDVEKNIPWPEAPLTICHLYVLAAQ